MQNRKYLNFYEEALQNYIGQKKRTHHTLADADDSDRRIFIFGFFSALRHSAKEYPALQALRSLLENDHSESQESARLAIKNHFFNEENKWNNHSFNNYLLDALKRHCSPAEWEKEWKQFDKAPIVYYKGLLFRGSSLSPNNAFRFGIKESVFNDSLDSYISDCNGDVGVSTSKLFHIAYSYALPMVRTDPHSSYAHEAYVYIVDYQGNLGIDLEETFTARGKTFAAYLSSNKGEVNIIGNIKPEEIVGAFYVNRKNEVRWHANPGYQRKDAHEILTDLETAKIPNEFLKQLHSHPVKKLS